MNGKTYYEVSFTAANDRVSKFDRILAFTSLDIMPNYAVRLGVQDVNLSFRGKKFPIKIIKDWRIDIRPCEIENFCKIFKPNAPKFSKTKLYEEFMQFLTKKQLTLLELIELDDDKFNKIKESYCKDKLVFFFECLQTCKKINKNKTGGVNILRYFLYHLNNKIIKNQFEAKPNEHLSNLYLKKKSIPFDKIPFNFSLCSHNPKLHDLFECIEVENRKDELLAGYIKNNTEMKGILYTSKEDLAHFKDTKQLVSSYNNKFYFTHKSQSIVEWKDYFYIESYEENIRAILKEIQRLADKGIENYQSDIEQWLESADIDCEDKKVKLRDLFTHSKAVFIYGSAGVGKTTMIKHISLFFQNKKKLFITNTHSALANLKARVESPIFNFYTVAKAIKGNKRLCDVLIIDECSTISNNDMCEILNKITCEILVCVGDIYQIESIRFGNWFAFVPNFIKKEAIIELTKPYRTSNEKLLDLWSKVRKLEDNITEALASGDYVKSLEDFEFCRGDDDEIILCLNYGGLYGINNINRIIQENNNNEAFEFKGLIYKKGDPILFNETQRFSDEIHNNLKGKIYEIVRIQNGLQFTVEVEKILKEPINQNFTLIKTENNKSIICFDTLNHNADNDDEKENNIVPFQVAYAISIHKAQGLEYDCVKIIISDDIEEQITHNIFYTAMTRARKSLKIFSSTETLNKILNSIISTNLAKIKDRNKDLNILTNKKD